MWFGVVWWLADLLRHTTATSPTFVFSMPSLLASTNWSTSSHCKLWWRKVWEVDASLTSVPHRTLAFNRFTGTIPANIGKLPRLKWLYVVTCRLWWDLAHLIVVVLPLSTPSELCMIIAWKDPCHPLDATRHNYNGCKMHCHCPVNSLHHTVLATQNCLQQPAEWDPATNSEQVYPVETSVRRHKLSCVSAN